MSNEFVKVKYKLKPALMHDKLQKNSDQWRRSSVGSIYHGDAQMQKPSTL
jgi:hypothetical protein